MASATAQAAASVIDVGFLRRLQADLGDAVIDDDPLRRRLEANYTLLESFARTWQAIAIDQVPALARVAPTLQPGDRTALLDLSALQFEMLSRTT